MMNQRSQGAFYYYYCFKTFKTQNFAIKLSNHLLKVNQIKQLPVGTILSFYYFGKTLLKLNFAHQVFGAAAGELTNLINFFFVIRLFLFPSSSTTSSFSFSYH